MAYFGHLDSKRGWTKQLHLGPLRSTNTRRLRELGPDTHVVAVCQPGPPVLAAI